MPKKSWQIIYSKLLCEVGQDFLDIWYDFGWEANFKELVPIQIFNGFQKNYPNILIKQQYLPIIVVFQNTPVM